MKISRKDVLWTYLAKFFTLGINIILLPLIMAYLSDTDLGLWYVFASISQIVTLFDFGFNATLSRHMTYAWSGAKSLKKTGVGECGSDGKPNTVLMAEVISTCRIVYLAISMAGLAVMLLPGTAYIYQVVNHRLTQKILWSWMIYVFAVFINLLYGYWSSLLNGIGAVAEKHKMSVYAKLIQLILSFVLLLRGWGLMGFVLSYAVSGITVRVIGRYYFLKKTKGLKFRIKIDSENVKSCFWTIWDTAWKDGIVMLAQYLSTQANTLVCAYFIDLDATSAYGVITQIGSMIGSLAASYYAAVQPEYNSLCLEREEHKLKRLTCKSIFIYKVVFLAMFSAFLTVGIPILHFIRPSMEAGMGMAVSVCVFYYLYNQHSLFCSMISSTNRIPYYKSYLLTALASVMLSILLSGVWKFGIWGLLAAQIAANLVYNNWFWPRYVMRAQGIHYREIYTIGFYEVTNKRI